MKNILLQDKAHRLQLTGEMLEEAGIDSNKVRIEVQDGKILIQKKVFQANRTKRQIKSIVIRTLSHTAYWYEPHWKWCKLELNNKLELISRYIAVCGKVLRDSSCQHRGWCLISRSSSEIPY